MEIKPLDARQIHSANSNSMKGARGDIIQHDYQTYTERIISWPVSDEKKQKLLDKLYQMFAKNLGYASRHVSVAVAGRSGYDAQRLDKSDQVLRTASEICNWFDSLEKQIKRFSRDDNKAAQVIEMIRFCDERPELNPTSNLMDLAYLDNAAFIQLYEKLRDKYRWRKNSNIYKLYQQSVAGEVKEIRKEIMVDEIDFTGYTEGDRAYIRFILFPKRQLKIALKSRGWWWNSYEDAFSTYLGKADWEWVRTIPTRYADYL